MVGLLPAALEVIDNSLSKITQVLGQIKTFEYWVDEKLNPTMKVELGSMESKASKLDSQAGH